MRCDVSTCALLTSHQIYLSSPPCNGLTHYVENECLICKWRIFAQDTWIPNACSPRRDEINVNSDVSNKTDRAGGKRNMQVYDDHNEHKITLKTPPGVTTHQPPQSMLRGGICLAPSKHLSPFNQKSFDGSWFEI